MKTRPAAWEPPRSAVLLIALALELALLGGIALALSRTRPVSAPPKQAPITVALAPALKLESPAQPHKTRPATPRPKPQQRPRPAPRPEHQPGPKPKSRRPSHMHPAAAPTHPVPSEPPLAQPRPEKQPAARAKPSGAAGPSPQSPETTPRQTRHAPPAPSAHARTRQEKMLKSSFKTRVRAAIQNAARYPRAAQMMGMTGTATVSFDYLDGHVSHVQLTRSSGADFLDRAAVRAVREASYPPPPKKLSGVRLHFAIPVRFSQGG